MQFDESEYDLTIAQARKIQANLVASGRPQRLLSEAELAEKERERIEKREKVSEVCALNTYFRHVSQCLCGLVLRVD